MVGTTKTVIKVLVTGANGQLGSEIVERCIERDYIVVPATRRNMDITRQYEVDKFILEHEPTHIIHCAAMTAVDDCESNQLKAESTNADGTRFIAGIAQHIGAHMTYISTDYVFDGKKGSPYEEEDATSPLSTYGLTKLLGENYAIKAGAVVRVSWLCGKNGPNMLKTILKYAEQTAELHFVTDQRGCPTFADDASAAILDIAIMNSIGKWHVTNQGEISWFDFAQSVVDIAGLNKPVIPTTTDQLPVKRAAKRPSNSVLRNKRMEDEGMKLLDHYEVPMERLIRLLSS